VDRTYVVRLTFSLVVFHLPVLFQLLLYLTLLLVLVMTLLHLNRVVSVLFVDFWLLLICQHLPAVAVAAFSEALVL
jgi:hypothetical protein